MKWNEYFSGISVSRIKRKDLKNPRNENPFISWEAIVRGIADLQPDEYLRIYGEIPLLPTNPNPTKNGEYFPYIPNTFMKLHETIDIGTFSEEELRQGRVTPVRL
ncbi:MAG: hypothetical protein AABX59_03110, partial [Nanoarchaeota archaeon]